MSYYIDMVQDMDDSQKLELVSILIDSVKPIQTRTLPDMPLEEDFPDMDKELYTPEEAYELTMKDIKAIYDKYKDDPLIRWKESIAKVVGAVSDCKD